jgi:Icc-related predicted phosphoesterase
MRILALSDKVVSHIHSPAIMQRYKDIELIVGCGDLPAAYLEYIVTLLPAPLVYVPGNHDPDNYHVPGGMDIDGRLVNVNGCWIMGLGGSHRYKIRGKHQYTEVEMHKRVARLLPRLLYNRIRYSRALDLLVTHSPARGIHDGKDVAHTGFGIFLNVIRWFQPGLMLHGHTHIMQNIEAAETEYHGCRIFNVYPAREVNLLKHCD